MVDVSGLLVPLITPFTDDGSQVSEIRISRLVRHLHDRDVAGFIVCSDTGEFFSMSMSERKELLEWVMRESRGKPVIAHVTASSTAATLDLAQHAGRHGCRGVIVMPPIYGPFVQDEKLKFIESIVSFANSPVVVVDHKRELTDASREELTRLTGVSIADPLPEPLGCHEEPMTDSFRLGTAVATPAALLVQHGELGAVASLIARFGGARVGKAGLEMLGMEMGNPRGPLRPLQGEGFDALRDALL